MVTDTRRFGCVIVAICLLWIDIASGQDAKKDPPTPVSAPATEAARTPTDQEGASSGIFDSAGFVDNLSEKLHKVLREERIKTLAEIDRERKETLSYLTRERQATMAELESIGDRIVANALVRSERLVDHFFIRALQLAGVILLAGGIFGLLILRLIKQNKARS